MSELLVYDAGAGRPLFSLTLPHDGERYYTGDIAGEEAIVTDGSTLLGINARSGRSRELFRPSPEEWINDVAGSPDGSTIAATVMRNFARATPSAEGSVIDIASRNAVLFIDATSGQEASRLERDEGFAGFSGVFHWVNWREDGAGVVVNGATGSERPGGTVTIYPDGRYVVHYLVDYMTLAPSARRAAHGDIPFACLAVASYELEVSDLDTGAVIARASDGRRALTAWDWSPDSEELLIASSEVAEMQFGLCPQSNSQRWLILDVSTGETRPAGDIKSLYQGWYGERILEARCEGGEPEAVDFSRWLDQYAGCPGSSQGTNELLLDGDVILRGDDFQILGFIE